MNAAERQAHQYAEHGWHVFPLQPDSKIPYPKSRGFEDATTDHRAIQRAWSVRPASNIGVRTGAPHGPTVLDVDCSHDKPGHASLNKAIRADLVPPPQAEIRTPSGGSHLYYKGDSQPSRVNDRTGLDLRSAGGYVAAPGSTVDGKPYVVMHRQLPAAVTVDYQAIADHLEPPQPKPDWHPRTGQAAGVAHLADYMARAEPGGRNARLFWSACRALEAGDTDTLSAISAAARSVGLADREISATVRSADRTVNASPKAPAIEREAG